MQKTHPANRLVVAPNSWSVRAQLLANQVIGHYQKHWLIWATTISLVVLFQVFFKVGVNVTESLPDKAFLVTKFDHKLSRGDFVSFSWEGNEPYPKGIEFVKIIKGVPGDVVSYRGRWVFVNDEFVAIAKTHSKTHKPLELGPSGVIPEGKYFVYASHPDSLDSRYALTGWIDQGAVRGRAYPIF